MPRPPLSTRLLRFGAFEVDVHSGELRKRGVRIKLQSQPFLLLVTLLKQQGDVITREELRATLWPDGTFIDFDHSLSTAVNKLREVLGDSATTPLFIETLPRRGYRFIAPVEAVVIEEKEPAAAEVLPPESQPEPSTPLAGPTESTLESASVTVAPAPAQHWHWATFWKATGLILVLAALTSFVIVRLRTSPPQSIRSLAVLPLENLSGDGSQDYFSEGMTDELITKLGQISELRVISRSSVMSYKKVNKPVRQIGQELGVDAVIEGTVLRSGKQIRITARLIDAASDRQLWAHDYEGDLRNTLALQNKVARDIADQIKIKLSSGEQSALKVSRDINAEAHEAYLKGRFFWNKRTGDDLKKAVEYFNLARAKDPNYAQAFSGLADSYALMGDWEYGVLGPKEMLPKAREAATKALALDNSLSEAHTSLAFALDLYDWDWESAENEFKRAIQLNPNYATAHQWYAWHLAMVGRNGEAAQEMQKAETLDPLSLIISADMADILLIARRLDDSVKQSRKTLEMDSRFAIAHYELGLALAQQQMFADAIDELQRAMALSGNNKTFASNLAYVYAIAGEKDKARELLANLKNPAQGFSNPSEIALVYVGLGNKDQAMMWLEKAYKERFNPSLLLRPCFDPLRSDPRFQDLMHRISPNN
jgi:TolB-like protein/DNA-binding winged helix-turn-helix (wHTH) protein/Flp pilus assembly protein TadD